MEQYISIIIFSLPGLITYFWIQMFGINPTTKHTPAEMVGITALLWAPTIFCTIIIYNFSYKILNSILLFLKIDLSYLKLNYLFDLNDLNEMSKSLIFIFLFILICLISSLLIAYVFSRYLYDKLLDFINKVRLQRNVIKLSKETSVWESFFYKLEENKEDQFIVEVYKLDKINSPEERLCGAAVRMSRPFEPDRSIVIDYSKGWEESHKHFKYPIKNIYVDTKSGVVINELDHKNPTVKENQPDNN